jgi:hypothetical protein
LYSSPIIIKIIKSRIMRWAGHVERIGEKRNAYRLMVERPEGERLLGRPRRRWVDNIKMDLGKIGWSDVDWIGLALNKDHLRALLNTVIGLRVPYNSRKFFSSRITSIFSRRAQLRGVTQLYR